jgi:hypothetical protein
MESDTESAGCLPQWRFPMAMGGFWWHDGRPRPWDSWCADDPRYEEKFSALGIRIGINNIMYAFTH